MKKTIIFAFIAFVLSLFTAAGPAVVHGEEESKHPIDVKLDKMMDKDSSTAEMIRAIDEGVKLWDEELNKNYKRLMAKLDDASKKALKKSQLKWIEYRDAEIEFIRESYSKMEGTMYRTISAGLVMGLTKKRALELKNYCDEMGACE